MLQGNLFAHDRNASGIRDFEHIDASQKRRLARARRAEDRDHFSLVGRQRYTVEDLQVTEVFPDVCQLNSWASRVRHGFRLFDRRDRTCVSFASLGPQSPFEQREETRNDEVEDEVDCAGTGKNLDGAIAFRDQFRGNSGDFHDGDGGRERRRLDHQDHFIAVAWQHLAYRLRDDDPPEQFTLPIPQALAASI